MAEYPNLLLIVIDSARADHLSCYGYDLPTTPNIDRIAAEGVRFDAAYSESSWTLPVAFTLLTGLAPREHEAESVRVVPPEIPSLAELLQRRGYATFGASSNSFFGSRTALDRGFDAFLRTTQTSFWTQALYRYGPQRLGWTDYGGGAMTERFLRWSAQARQPWFAMIWHNEPHHPYSARRPFTTRFLRRRISVFRRVSLVRRMRRMLSLACEATPEDLLDMTGLYDGCLGYADRLVGRAREGLERQGQWGNTGVVVLADHGDMLGERGLLGHGRTADMYAPLLRVPLVARLPGLGARGQASSAIVQMADIPRTLDALAGGSAELAATAAETVDLRDAADGRGRSMAISERQPMGERSVLSAQKKSPTFDFAPHLCHMTAVLRDGWRLIHRADGRHELYHVAVDPDEKDDLAEREPARLQELVRIVEDWQSRAVPHPATASLTKRDEAIVEKRLQDLGYF
jgi:arylsulfatase A-like enzyme